jgi:hypothetical protein
MWCRGRQWYLGKSRFRHTVCQSFATASVKKTPQQPSRFLGKSVKVFGQKCQGFWAKVSRFLGKSVKVSPHLNGTWHLTYWCPKPILGIGTSTKQRKSLGAPGETEAITKADRGRPSRRYSIIQPARRQTQAGFRICIENLLKTL